MRTSPTSRCRCLVQIPPSGNRASGFRSAYVYEEMAHAQRQKQVTDTPRHTPGEKHDLATRKQLQLDGHAAHVDIDELYSSDGLFAVISQRRANGAFTFAVFKSFDRGTGVLERTSFIPEELGPSYVKLAGLALERMEQIRSEGTAPFKERR